MELALDFRSENFNIHSNGGFGPNASQNIGHFSNANKTLNARNATQWLCSTTINPFVGIAGVLHSEVERLAGAALIDHVSRLQFG